MGLQSKNLRFQIPERHARLRLVGQKIEVCEERDGRRGATDGGKTITLETALEPMRDPSPALCTISAAPKQSLAKSRRRVRRKPSPTTLGDGDFAPLTALLRRV